MQHHVLIDERKHSKIKQHHRQTGIPINKIMESIIDSSNYYKNQVSNKKRLK